ncbi:hypothetical protein AVEN_178720-1, partial [Araneus ventricosus]
MSVCRKFYSRERERIATSKGRLRGIQGFDREGATRTEMTSTTLINNLENGRLLQGHGKAPLRVKGETVSDQLPKNNFSKTSLSMPNQFPPFFISRKTALIGILNMMFIVGQCVPFNPGPFFNNDFDYKASSINSGDSQNNYPIERLSTEKYKSPTDDDKYLSVEKREISGLNTDSSFKSESPEPAESLFLRIRKRDDDEESSPQPESDENEEEPKAESGKNEEEPKPESGGNEEEPKPESGENEEKPKPESGGNEESPAQEQNEEKPDDQEEGLIPPPSKESLPPEPVEEEESSTSNLEEPPVLPTSNQEDMPFSKNKDTSEEDFVFQKKPLSFGVL